MIAMEVVGLGALLETPEVAFQVVKWAGVCHFAHLGVIMMSAQSEAEDDSAGLPHSDRACAFARYFKVRDTIVGFGSFLAGMGSKTASLPLEHDGRERHAVPGRSVQTRTGRVTTGPG